MPPHHSSHTPSLFAWLCACNTVSVCVCVCVSACVCVCVAVLQLLWLQTHVQLLQAYVSMHASDWLQDALSGFVGEVMEAARQHGQLSVRPRQRMHPSHAHTNACTHHTHTQMHAHTHTHT